MSAPDREPDTFPKLLLEHAQKRPAKIAFCEKDYGIWQSWGWGDVTANVRTLAAGLAARGFTRGDRLAIVGDNRPRLYWAMAAAQALGGVPVPLYQDAVTDEMAYTLAHAEASLAIAEDQEQVDKLREIRARGMPLKEIFYDDPRGLARYSDPALRSLDFLFEEGRAFLAKHPAYVDEEIAKGRGADVAIILYTSGTTGHAKGVMLTHDALITTAKNGLEREGLTADEKMLAYLPMAWVGDNLFSYAQALVGGFTVGCPESIDTVLLDLKEIGPTYFFGPPRVYESLLTQMTIRMEDASSLKKWLFSTFMGIARRVGPKLLEKRPATLRERLAYLLGNVLIYAPLKNVLGLSKVRLAYTAGEAVGPDVLLSFRALGINVKQFYGMTEASVFISIQPNGAVKPESSGTPLKDVEVKIAEDGEVLFKSPGSFHAYYKDPEATAAARTADGWVKTGDAGFLDEEGHLRIIDRAKDVGRLQDGSLFAPKYLENKLKFFPYIKEAVAFGDGRDAAAAFVNIDLPCVANWAEHHDLAFAGYMDLAARDEVYALVKDCVEKVNRDLSKESRLASSQIRRFLILPKELDADDGELTRTRKVRRRIIAERYQGLIDALYSDQTSVPFDTPVRFEDGRAGVVKTSVRLEEAKLFPAAAAMRGAA